MEFAIGGAIPTKTARANLRARARARPSGRFVIAFRWVDVAGV